MGQLLVDVLGATFDDVEAEPSCGCDGWTAVRCRLARVPAIVFVHPHSKEDDSNRAPVHQIWPVAQVSELTGKLELRSVQAFETVRAQLAKHLDSKQTSSASNQGRKRSAASVRRQKRLVARVFKGLLGIASR